jgi:anti-anti-sigma factor
MAYESPFFDQVNKANEGFKINGDYLKGDNSQLVIIVEGVLETDNSETFVNTIMNTLAQTNGLKKVIFDLKKLTYVSSTGLGSFTAILSKTKQYNIEIFFINVNEKILSVIDVLGFSRFFQILNSLNDI